jgi:hypothetical protein
MTQPQRHPPHDPGHDELRAQAQRIRTSGLLGRSGQLLRLFDFLVACSERGHVPKEVEIAMDALARDAGFDASQDAVVRVTVHKLRRRLDEFYASPQGRTEPRRLVLPRGEYRLLLAANDDGVAALAESAAPQDAPEEGLPAAPGTAVPRPRWWWPATRLERVLAATTLAMGLLLAGVAAVGPGRGAGDVPARVAAARASALWAPLLADDRPIQIVIGDYYIFGERNATGAVERLVRDFDVNSRDDLQRRFAADPELVRRYVDLDLGYLPTSSARALREILPLLAATPKPVRVSLASEVDPSTFKTSHVVYIGYLSGLGMLFDVAFQHSRFEIGGSFDEIVDAATGLVYASEAGGPVDPGVRYRDYAYVSSFGGQNGNRFIVIAGARDPAVIQAAEILADPRQLAALRASVEDAADYEALFEVAGLSRTNLEAQRVVAAPLP